MSGSEGIRFRINNSVVVARPKSIGVTKVLIRTWRACLVSLVWRERQRRMHCFADGRIEDADTTSTSAQAQTVT